MPFNCSVCFESLAKEGPADAIEASGDERPESFLVLVRCGHMMHRTCLTGWLARPSNSGKCPKCKNKVKLGEAIAVYPSISSSVDEYEDVVGESTKRVEATNSKKSSPPSTSKLVDYSKPQTVPEVRHVDPQCQDLLAVHATLVEDYNATLAKVMAQDEAIDRENRICELIQDEINEFEEGVDKLQKERISELLKRTQCTCHQNEEEDDEEGEEYEVQDDDED